ncbi:hypothetical protein GGI35DRAFT_489547 [Trichoderma velutinum]
MANHQGHEETLEGVKNPALRSFDDLDAESQDFVRDLQRRNLNFLQNDPSITIANGVRLYYDGRGRILAAGAESRVKESSEEPQIDIIWGPGAEASVAKDIIETASGIKHKVWITALDGLSEMPATPNVAPVVIGFLRRAIAEERECWAQLDALKTVNSLQSLLALDMEAILTSMCSLAGIVVRRGRYFSYAASKGGHHDLASKLFWLQDNHNFDKKDKNVSTRFHRGNIGQTRLDDFKMNWTPIVEKLLPGRLADKMERYVDKMQYLLDNDERYSSPRKVGSGDWDSDDTDMDQSDSD